MQIESNGLIYVLLHTNDFPLLDLTSQPDGFPLVPENLHSISMARTTSEHPDIAIGMTYAEVIHRLGRHYRPFYGPRADSVILIYDDVSIYFIGNLTRTTSPRVTEIHKTRPSDNEFVKYTPYADIVDSALLFITGPQSDLSARRSWNIKEVKIHLARPAVTLSVQDTNGAVCVLHAWPSGHNDYNVPMIRIDFGDRLFQMTDAEARQIQAIYDAMHKIESPDV